jgi:intracellular septation protein
MGSALLQLAEDFLSAFVFLGFYLATGNLPLAVGLAMAVGLAQFALAKWRGRRLEAMQWLSLGLVIVLGAVTLFTNDSRFMMAKPSFIHFAIGAVMLRPGWMDRYLPPAVKDNLPQQIIVLTGYAWAGLMFTLGLLNLYVAANYGLVAWGYSYPSARRVRRSLRSSPSISLSRSSFAATCGQRRRRLCRQTDSTHYNFSGGP